MSKLMDLKDMPAEGQKYRHEGTGREYTVKCLARNDDTDEILVIHSGADGSVWARTLGNFMGLNITGGARFVKAATPTITSQGQSTETTASALENTKGPAFQEIHQKFTEMSKQLSDLASVVQGVVIARGEDGWNSPDQLPPVGCPLKIRVPKYTGISVPGSPPHPPIALLVASEDFESKAERTCHVSARGKPLVYKLEDGTVVKGRFEWTYP